MWNLSLIYNGFEHKFRVVRESDQMNLWSVWPVGIKRQTLAESLIHTCWYVRESSSSGKSQMLNFGMRLERQVRHPVSIELELLFNPAGNFIHFKVLCSGDRHIVDFENYELIARDHTREDVELEKTLAKLADNEPALSPCARFLIWSAARG